jgi:plastocyanin
MTLPARLFIAVAGLVAVITLAGAAAGAAGAENAAPHADASLGRLMVSGDEFSLVLSRRSIAPGAALIQFVNRGEDPHDLRIRKLRGRRAVDFGELPSGELAEVETRLSTGRYRLWCSLSGHRKAGMRAVLTVRR